MAASHCPPSGFFWPEGASRVQLLVGAAPRQRGEGQQRSSSSWRDGGNKARAAGEADGLLRGGGASLCHVEYCPRPAAAAAAEGEAAVAGGGGFLKIVTSDDSRTVLDAVDADDVIGASIEVRWNEEGGGGYDRAAEPGAAARPSPRALRKGGGQKPSSPSPCDELVDRQAHATLHIYCYPKVSKEGTASSVLGRIFGRNSSSSASSPSSPPARPLPRAAAHRFYALAPAEDLGAARSLVRSIRRAAAIAASSPPPPAESDRENGESSGGGGDPDDEGALPRERYLVLVNPVSGKGRAPREAREVVVPMLGQAGIEAVVEETRYPGHAAEIVAASSSARESLAGGEGAGGVGGDPDGAAITGILVVGGDGVYHECVNALASVSPSGDQPPPLLGRIKLGMIPCGTGSGLAASLAHASGEDCNVVSCCFLACKGQVAMADTSLYETRAAARTSFLTFSWGLVADVDLESECIRWLGTARLDLWAVLRIVFLRTYRGRLSYTAAPVAPATPQLSDRRSDGASKESSTSSPPMPALHDPVPADWTVVDDEFILFWASHVTHASVGFHHSPRSRVGDGSFQIMIVRRPMSRLQMVRILLSIDAGRHVGLRGVEFVRCTAFRLEPTGSHNVIDGEEVEPGPVQARVVPRSMRVFCRPRQQQQQGAPP